MSYGTKYRSEFTDINLTDWRIDYMFDGYASTITDLVCSGNPASIEHFGDDDIMSSAVLGSQFNHEVKCDTDFALSEFFTTEDLAIKVEVYRKLVDTSEVLHWTGFVLANNYKEPYNCAPYPITITSVDGPVS